jgi:pimeloyl-ACP methyl ester carboxylesterase
MTALNWLTNDEHMIQFFSTLLQRCAKGVTTSATADPRHSDGPKQDYTVPRVADDLAGISAQLNLERPIVVGHSMGGNIALELAAQYPQLACCGRVWLIP